MPGRRKIRKRGGRTKLRGVLQASCCLKRSDCCLPPTPCTSCKILEGSTNFCLLFCSCFPSPCCSWNCCYNTQLTPDHIYPASPLYGRHQSRTGHFKEMKINPDMTTGTAVTTPNSLRTIYTRPALYMADINPKQDIHMDTSVCRYCDQGAWTDLICSMDKTPPTPPPKNYYFIDN
ncbi:hypothetical protein LAZ67_8002471 [Cordylochernes scorpioides]|uniref:Uncharacterized protein n=1 Tax=Cordylochernes scorpioides TaxID=51811 RepID=A0ABY6KRI0_9ARAC|nr:hypothetical protein LAZ67_8002471 [Cordylochernes scorpioides]